MPVAAPAPAPPTIPVRTAEARRERLARKLLRLPKPILFGLCGGLGGLLGAVLLGELLWAVLSPSGETHSAAPVQVVVVEPPEDVAPREPSVQLALPASLRVYVGGKNRLVVNIGRDGFDGPVTLDSFRTPDGLTVAPVAVAPGKDTAEVEVAADGSVASGTYLLPLRVRGPDGQKVREDAGDVEVKVERPPPSLRVSVSPNVPFYQGGKGRFNVLVRRDKFDGPITLKFEGLPETVRLTDAVIPAGKNEVEVEVSAPRDQAPAAWPVRLEASGSAGGERVPDTAEFNVEVMRLPTPEADILFVLDLTGSMGFAIDGVKKGIRQFADALKKQDVDARVGLVGFRDIEEDRERPFVMRVNDETFTRDYEAFQQELQKQTARGGGDEPESSLQGLALASQQSFRPNAARVLVLITDASPKIHKNEKPSTVGETIDELTKNKMSQVHLVVRQVDYDRSYKPVGDKFRGTFIDLTMVNEKSDAFVGILSKLGDDISRITTSAAEPPPPKGPAPLPPATAAKLPPPLPPATTTKRPAVAKVILPPARPPVVRAVQSTQTYAETDRTRLLLAIAVWTMVIAGCISLLILAGQEFYTRRAWVTPGAGGRCVAGGLLAGLVGGVAGQVFFQATSGGTAWDLVSRVLGWGLLGGLIGGCMSLFVPNLKWTRGLLGGVLGGVLGAAGFLLVSLAAGSLPGRWIGAAVLGFCIGLMVALAELVFRRWWLEIAFGPREVRTVTLGTAAIAIGGDERLVSVFVSDSPPVTLRYRVEGGRVLCEDVVAEQTVEAAPGESRTLGRVTVTVRSAASARQIGYVLKLYNGRSYLLAQGLPLTAEELPGLEAQAADGVVALVASRPNDPASLLLRNRSKQPWTVVADDGTRQTTEPGGAVEMGAEVEVVFGGLRGMLKRDVSRTR
jgi:Mg-chelatase subunit ChlD